MRGWEQNRLDLEEMRMASQEADQTEGVEETDGIETTAEDQLSREDTVVTITLGTEPNSTFAYAPGLELHDQIMSKLGEYRSQ